METTMLLSAILLVVLLDQSLGYSSVAVFYVKPTGPTTDCPSGNSPCHSLQYYANHSTFTNNSMFLFLEGEHHLDSVVAIRNVANLSLVGASSGVRILCKSPPSGFHVEEFIGLTIENMAISNCYGSENVTLYLQTGSELSLDHVTISGYEATGLVAIDLLGSFSIFNSNFSVPQGRNIIVKYSLCNNRPSYFNFSNNEVTAGSEGAGIEIGMYCPNVQILIATSIFEVGLSIEYGVVTNNSVEVSNSTLGGIHYFGSSASYLQCSHDFLKFTGVTAVNGNIFIDFGITKTKDCAVIIEDSTFRSSFVLSLEFTTYNSSNSTSDTSVRAILNNVTFANNSVGLGSGVLNLMAVTVVFQDFTFVNNVGASGIQTHNSKLIFQGNNTFKNNSALIGAGISLVEDSYMYLRTRTNISFEDNHADYVGGAIYTDSKPGDPCFFHVDPPALNKTDVGVSFVRNTADYGGSSLYGDVTSCCESDSSCNQLYNVFNTSNTEKDPSAIASDPYNICLCEDRKLQPNCSDLNKDYSIHAFPGQEFPVCLAVVGVWFNGVVRGSVRAYFGSSYNATLGPLQASQTSDKPYCKNFNYSVTTAQSTEIFLILPEDNFFEQITSTTSPPVLSVTVNLKNCPLGFSLSPTTASCVCDPRIAINIKCDINDQSFLRPANSWIGFVDESDSNKTGVIFHLHCPTDYCLPHDVKVTSNTSDNQCEPHRTGLLCGRCEEGYSLTIGNQECTECSNTYLLLILPFAVAGLLLVAVLFALNLTVTEGSINGVIFYANVMGMNHIISFAGEGSYLYVFLAWPNLDLGINTCLFDGMDGYAHTWLQFVFPVYLWVIILVIIQFYNKFPGLANRLGGENAVKVLATLLLLSYTKLQRTVVTILSFTWLEYPDGAVRYVWLYDANVEFFKGKHLYLGIAGILVLVFLIVPYTLCLAFFQQLQACSGHRLFQWVNKLKPVFDSYAGPYKDKYRFWTGMLLAVRTLLIILFTANTAGSVDFNLLIILVVSCTLLMAHSNGIYKKCPCNYIESFFYLQLGVFAGGISYVRHTRYHGNIAAVANTSIGLSLTVFLAVVGYHILCRATCFKKYYYRLKGYADIVEEDHLLSHERITN